jgi:hypothetical protein
LRKLYKSGYEKRRKRSSG